MKKLFPIALALLMTGCATTADSQNPLTQTGRSLFKTAVKQKCQSDIVDNKYIKAIGPFVGADMQSKVADTVCTCVSEHGVDQVSLTEIATATVDSSARPKIVAKAVQGSMKACANDYIEKSPFAGLIKF